MWFSHSGVGHADILTLCAIKLGKKWKAGSASSLLSWRLIFKNILRGGFWSSFGSRILILVYKFLNLANCDITVLLGGDEMLVRTKIGEFRDGTRRLYCSFGFQTSLCGLWNSVPIVRSWRENAVFSYTLKQEIIGVLCRQLWIRVWWVDCELMYGYVCGNRSCIWGRKKRVVVSYL